MVANPTFTVGLGIIQSRTDAGQSTFKATKTLWHRFDRHDFLVDEDTLVLTQIKAAEDEKSETHREATRFHHTTGQRRCLVVGSKVAAPDNPGIRWESHIKLAELIKNDVTLLNICGSLDTYGPWRADDRHCLGRCEI